MDQHPVNPKSPRSEHRRRSFSGRIILTLALCLVVAAATLGTGIYLKRESPTWQRILGTEPAVVVQPQATDELPVLITSLEYLLEYPETSTGAKTTAALRGTLSMLQTHVELLTPGALAPAQGPTGTEEQASDAPVAAIPPLSPAEFAHELALTGNNLLTAALAAPQQEARRLSGAGIELALQGRTVLLAAGATQAQLDELPSPATALAADPQAAATPAATGETDVEAEMPDFVFATCPAVTPTESSDIQGPEPVSQDSGLLLGQVIDAAYRMGYAYNVAGARTSANLRTSAWDRSEALVDFATALQRQLDAALDCDPLREPAYQLPEDAVKNPMDAARSGEGQLALLLRDAAATQTGDARLYLLRSAWAQTLQTQRATGATPDFTELPSAPTAAAQSTGE